jgi:hypothetical protein
MLPNYLVHTHFADDTCIHTPLTAMSVVLLESCSAASHQCSRGLSAGILKSMKIRLRISIYPVEMDRENLILIERTQHSLR